MPARSLDKKSPFHRPILDDCATGIVGEARQGATAPRFLIADDHRFVCEALADMIGRHWPKAAISQAGGFNGVMALLAKAEFDVAILDFCMPDAYGGAAIEKIRTLYPDLKIVILSGAIEPHDALQALALGVVAYVPKSIAGDSIVHVLTLVLEGETYVPRGLIDAIMRGPHDETGAGTVRAACLTDRDSTLLGALVKGYPNKVIAHSMGVSESTVKFYLHKLFRTLGVHNRTEAVARGLHRMRPMGDERP